MTPDQVALVAQVHKEDREAWEREVERELDPCQRGVHVEIVGGRKYVHGTTGVTYWTGTSSYDISKTIVGVHPDADPTAKMYIDSRWLRVIDGCEPSLAEYTSTDEEAFMIVLDQKLAKLTDLPMPHTVRGAPIGPEGVPYGTKHDMNCPACIASGASFTASPRSETYWSS